MVKIVRLVVFCFYSITCPEKAVSLGLLKRWRFCLFLHSVSAPVELLSALCFVYFSFRIVATFIVGLVE